MATRGAIGSMRKNLVARSVLQWYIFFSTTLDQAVIAAPHRSGSMDWFSAMQCCRDCYEVSESAPHQKNQGRDANYRWRKRTMSQQQKRKNVLKPAVTALATAVTLAIANQASA